MHETLRIIEEYLYENGIKILIDTRDKNHATVFYGFHADFAVEGRLTVEDGHIIVDKTQKICDVEFDLYEPDSLNRLVAHLWRIHNLPEGAEWLPPDALIICLP